MSSTSVSTQFGNYSTAPDTVVWNGYGRLAVSWNFISPEQQPDGS